MPRSWPPKPGPSVSILNDREDVFSIQFPPIVAAQSMVTTIDGGFDEDPHGIRKRPSGAMAYHSPLSSRFKSPLLHTVNNGSGAPSSPAVNRTRITWVVRL